MGTEAARYVRPIDGTYYTGTGRFKTSRSKACHPFFFKLQYVAMHVWCMVHQSTPACNRTDSNAMLALLLMMQLVLLNISCMCLSLLYSMSLLFAAIIVAATVPPLLLR